MNIQGDATRFGRGESSCVPLRCWSEAVGGNRAGPIPLRGFLVQLTRVGTPREFQQYQTKPRGTRTPGRVDDMSAADLMKRVEQIYQDRLQSELERTHPDDFVAIEPDSGEYFLGRTLSEAAADGACGLSEPPNRCAPRRPSRHFVPRGKPKMTGTVDSLGLGVLLRVRCSIRSRQARSRWTSGSTPDLRRISHPATADRRFGLATWAGGKGNPGRWFADRPRHLPLPCGLVWRVARNRGGRQPGTVPAARYWFVAWA